MKHHQPRDIVIILPEKDIIPGEKHLYLYGFSGVRLTTVHSSKTPETRSCHVHVI